MSRLCERATFLRRTFVLLSFVSETTSSLTSKPLSAFAANADLVRRRHRTPAACSVTSVKMMSADKRLRVYLVRHGAVDLNTPGMVYPKDCFYGGQNVPLSDLGKAEAQAAADFLKSEQVDMVFSSPLSRALYGAERIAANYGLTPIQDDRFREINRGRWLGLTKEQVREKFPGDLESYAADPHWCGHGGETFTQLSTRVLQGRNRVLEEAAAQGAKTVCIVSHMHVTKSILAEALRLAPTQQDKWEELKVPTASVSLIEYPWAGPASEATIVYIGTKPPVKAAPAAAAVGTGWGG